MDGSWWSVLAGVGGGLLLLWVVLIAALWLARPDELRIGDALRLLPDLVRLLRRLASDASLPRGVRVRLWLLLGYLALPFDVVPDFIPVIGYADDAVIVAFALRSVTRHAGSAALERHWPGSPEASSHGRGAVSSRMVWSVRLGGPMVETVVVVWTAHQGMSRANMRGAL